MKLVKLKVLFLSHSFLPISPIREYWTITHNHIPPATLSGLLLRAVLFSVNPKSIYGDYIPCEAGKGLLVKVSNQRAEWTKARREETVEGFKPPYMEYHFKAVSLGAYDEATLSGKPPRWGYVEKFWNNLKYIDPEDENLFAPLTVGIKTWHFAVLDGAKLMYAVDSKTGRIKQKQYITYDVVKVRFDFPPSYLYGLLLLEDDSLSKPLQALLTGWFVDKTRLKTLVAVKVEEIMEQSTSKEDTKCLYVVPSPRRPRRPSYAFTSALLSSDALRGARRDLSVEKTTLYVEKRENVDLREKLVFKGRDGSLFAVDRSWAEYLRLAKGGSP